MTKKQYIILHHEDMSFAILCVDDIKTVSMTDFGRTLIRYKDMDVIVRETPREILDMRLALQDEGSDEESKL